MHGEKQTRVVASFLLVAMVALYGAGCDQVGDIVDDVKSKVTEEETPAVESNPAPAPTPMQPAPAPAPAAPQPTPEELVAEFKKLQPHQITDSALARVTSQPEAAAQITELEVNAIDVSVGGLQSMAAMTNLTSLKFASAKMKPDQLRNLAGIKSLKELTISGSKTDDSVVQSLSSLPDLELLNISGTAITPAAAASLSQMKNLQSVDLKATNSDDSTVAALSALPIRSLDLSKTRVSNASLPVLIKMPNLEELNLSFTSVTGEGFKGFGRSSLKVLRVGETRFGVEGLANIKGMKALEELNVYRAGVVEHRAANVFKTFPKLKILNAGGNTITDAGMNVFFKGHRSLEVLKLGHNKKITDNGLAALVAVKTLKELDLTGTACGAQGARALKERLPDCMIQTPSGQF